MNRELKALSALLGYPDAALRAALPEIAEAIGGATRLPGHVKTAIADLIGEFAGSDPYELEAAYVALFDRGRATSLHLFEHVHGESRDRGQAMVSLRELYERAGLALATGELPDYLPAVLEYAALAPAAEAKSMLCECEHILRSIGGALVARESRYAGVIDGLLAYAGAAPIDRQRAVRSQRPERPLDEEWMDEPVTFGPPAACAGSVNCASGVRRGAARAAIATRAVSQSRSEP